MNQTHNSQNNRPFININSKLYVSNRFGSITKMLFDYVKSKR